MSEAARRSLERTLEVWQPRSLRRLSPEDTRQIAENVRGFFDTLIKWNAESHHAGRHRGHESPEKLASPELPRRHKADKRSS